MRRAGVPSRGSWSSSWPGKVRLDEGLPLRLTSRARLRRLGAYRPTMPRIAQNSVSLLFLALLASPAGAGSAGSVYQFEDEQGVVHYTNVPSDPRYGFVRTDPEPPRAGPAPTDARSASANDSGALSRGLRAFGQIIRSTAERYGVDTRLVEAIVQVESAGNPMAVSPKGARGLMQLMPERAVELGVRDSFDPRQNVDGGVRHMRD